MNGFQKGIKIAAICLAVIIIVNIFSWMIFGISMFIRITQYGDFNETSENYNETIYDYKEEIDQSISRIDVDVKSAELIIESSGDNFSVEINDKSNYTVRTSNGKLKIEEKGNWFWKTKQAEKIKINIPEDEILKELDIDAGGAKITIDGISAEKFSINHGAGKLEILNSKFDKADIDAGAGETTISNATLNNLDLDAGVRKSRYKRKNYRKKFYRMWNR